MTDQTNSPQLRFTNDDGRDFPIWEVHQLSELCDVRDGTHDTPKPTSEGYPLVTSKNLGTDGQLKMNDTYNISEYDYHEINKRSKVSVNDILFGMIGTIGNPVLLNSEGFAIKNVALIKSGKQINNNFLYYYFNTQPIERQFHESNVGGTQKFLSLKTIRGLLIKVPSKPEQQKIATFLTAVDNRIKQLEKKKELMEEYKKGMMQKIFSQKTRFKDEDGKDYPQWQEKSLRSVCEINKKSGGLPNRFIYIDLESVSKGRLIKRVTVAVEKAPSRAQRVLKKGDVLFQTVRPYQMNNYFFELDGDYVASTGYARLEANEDSRFLYQLIHTKSFVNKVLRRCTGTSYPAISPSDLGLIKVMMPSIKEQQKIATFLTALDNNINQISEQVKLNKKFKKGLLQQLFV